MSRHSIAPISVGELARRVGGELSVIGDPSVVVTGITQDSREVAAGDLFCCISGGTHDGHQFARDARDRGAVAFVAEHELPGVSPEAPRIEAGNVRVAIGPIARVAFGSPSSSLTLVGVTGTNGKTSTVAMIASILEASGSGVRVIGTLSGARTTPEAIDLHAQFRDAVADGCDTVVMEVSSHALDQHRVDGVSFEVAVFTNLGRDHLDYHETMENYFLAKARLFGPDLSRVGVVNLDDEYGRRLAGSASIPVVGFSLADASDVVVGAQRVTFSWRGRPVVLPVGGGFMLHNALAAMTAATELGVVGDAIVDGLANLKPIRGRFDTIESDDGFAVVVDYAHTPEGLNELLRSARAVARGRVSVVFGCGGDRDKGKRPVMGQVAASLADTVIVTSDNPRNEDPAAIIAEILAGIEPGAAEVHAEPDRAKAIASAISRAGRGDIVVIAGKGHESVQEIAGRSIPFDDYDIASGLVDARRQRTDGGYESGTAATRAQDGRDKGGST